MDPDGDGDVDMDLDDGPLGRFCDDADHVVVEVILLVAEFGVIIHCPRRPGVVDLTTGTSMRPRWRKLEEDIGEILADVIIKSKETTVREVVSLQ